VGTSGTQGFAGKLEGKYCLDSLGIDGNVIAKWIIKKWDRTSWTGLIWL
jgi:hypothetical protein